MGTHAAAAANGKRSSMLCNQPLQDSALHESALRAFNIPLEAWAAQQLPQFGATGDSDHDPSLQLAEVVDRSLHYLLSRVTLGISPMALMETYLDWLIHLSVSPGKQLQLWHKACARACGWPLTSPAAWRRADAGNRHAFRRCRRTSGSAVRIGSSGRSTSFIKLSCCSSSGGTMQ